MALRDFSDEEMTLLSRVIKREKQSIVNPRGRSSQDQFGENQDWLAPEVYIAAIQSEPIPALIPTEATGTGGTGTGTGSGYDTPGSATCDIYRIVGGQLRPAGFSKTVYNLSLSSIQSEWFTVCRDKYGNWIAVNTVSGLVSIKIKEASTGTSTNLSTAITRTSHPDGFSVIRVDENYEETGSTFTAYADELVGLLWSERIVRVALNGTKWQIASPGVIYWQNAMLLEDISVSSGLGRLFEGGPTVSIYSGVLLPASTVGDVLFDDEQQLCVMIAPHCQVVG